MACVFSWREPDASTPESEQRRDGKRKKERSAATRQLPFKSEGEKRMLRQRKNTKEFDRKVKENPRRWGEEGGDFLLIYALKMPAIDIHRYCHSRVARRPCLGQQPKLKLHFTVVFQVVAQLSRNFNIPRRERLKIQPATCHSIATFHATCPLPAPPPLRV